MKESNFPKKIRIATAFVQNFKAFQAKFDFLRKVHPYFLMVSYHLLTDLFQDKTITVGFLRASYVFEPLKIMLKP